MRGKRNFTAENVNKLVELFGLSAEYLLKREDNLPATLSEAEKSSNRSAAQRQESPYKNLLCEMDKQHISYTALAKILGLARRTVSDKMRGEVRFLERNVAKLVKIFGKPAEYLMARDD